MLQGSQPTPLDPADVDTEQLKMVCLRLSSLLGSDDGEAVEVAHEQAALLEAAFPEQFSELFDAITSFRFEQALELLMRAQATRG